MTKNKWTNEGKRILLNAAKGLNKAIADAEMTIGKRGEVWIFATDYPELYAYPPIKILIEREFEILEILNKNGLLNTSE